MLRPEITKGINTLKISLHAVGVPAMYIPMVEELVISANKLSAASYKFSRFIFLQELNSSPTAHVTYLIKDMFFYYVIMSMAGPWTPNLENSKTGDYQAKVGQYLDDYLAVEQGTHMGLKSMACVANYLRTQMTTAYSNNVLLNLVKQLMRLINRKTKRYIRDNNLTDVSQRIVANEVKAYMVNWASLAFRSPHAEHICRDLMPVRDALRKQYIWRKDKRMWKYEDSQFHSKDKRKNNVHYAVKVSPLRFINAYFLICRGLEDLGYTPPQCFPLHEGFIPGHIPLDYAVLKAHVLIDWKRVALDKEELWTLFLDRESQPILDQARNGSAVKRYFMGMAYTDGEAISLVMKSLAYAEISKNLTASAGNQTFFHHTPSELEEYRIYLLEQQMAGKNEVYFTDLPLDIARTTNDMVVTRDPGMRDLGYFVDEKSTIDNPLVCRSTFSFRNVMLKKRKYERIREDLKDELVYYTVNSTDGVVIRHDPIREAEQQLSSHSSTTTYVATFCSYLIVHAHASRTLTPFYSRTMTRGPVIHLTLDMNQQAGQPIMSYVPGGASPSISSLCLQNKTHLQYLPQPPALDSQFYSPVITYLPHKSTDGQANQYSSIPPFIGSDTFVVRPDWKAIPDLMPTDDQMHRYEYGDKTNIPVVSMPSNYQPAIVPEFGLGSLYSIPRHQPSNIAPALAPFASTIPPAICYSANREQVGTTPNANGVDVDHCVFNNMAYCLDGVRYDNNISKAHRALRLNAYINQKQYEQVQVQQLIDIFGRECIIVTGDYSNPRRKFFQPVPGVEYRRMLRQAGLTVYLIGEFRTSVLCPGCGKRLVFVKKRYSPRPYQAKKGHKAVVHGLLQCRSEACKVTVVNKDGTVRREYRLWNRDLVGCLNMLSKIEQYRMNGTIPLRFDREVDIVGPETPASMVDVTKLQK